MNLKFPISLVGKRGGGVPANITTMPVYYADMADGSGTTQVGPSNLAVVNTSTNPSGAPDGAGSAVLPADGYFVRGGYANVLDMAGTTAYSMSVWSKFDEIPNAIAFKGQMVAYWGKINEENFQISAGANSTSNLIYSPRKIPNAIAFKGQMVAYWGKINEENFQISAGANSTSNLIYSPRKTNPDINAGAIVAGEWYHTLITWDYNEYKMYLNGQLIDTKTTTLDSLWLANGTLTLGASYPLSDERYRFTGELSMFGMWREVLTAEDALYMYNAGQGRRHNNISL